MFPLNFTILLIVLVQYSNICTCAKIATTSNNQNVCDSLESFITSELCRNLGDNHSLELARARARCLNQVHECQEAQGFLNQIIWKLKCPSVFDQDPAHILFAILEIASTCLHQRSINVAAKLDEVYYTLMDEIDTLAPEWKLSKNWIMNGEIQISKQNNNISWTEDILTILTIQANKFNETFHIIESSSKAYQNVSQCMNEVPELENIPTIFNNTLFDSFVHAFTNEYIGWSVEDLFVEAVHRSMQTVAINVIIMLILNFASAKIRITITASLIIFYSWVLFLVLQPADSTMFGIVMISTNLSIVLLQLFFFASVH